MVKYILFILFFLTQTFLVYSQGQIIFKDNFKNNKRKWVLKDDSSFLVKIKDGGLHLAKHQKNRVNNGCLWYQKEIPKLNTAKDFSITFYARLLDSGEVKSNFDIQWGYWENEVPGSNKKLFQFNFLGEKIRLDDFDTQRKQRWSNSQNISIKSKLDSLSYNPLSFNKYELIQKQGRFSFKINGSECYTTTITPIEGNGIGFLQCLKSAWVIDKIIIRKIRKE